MPPPKLFRAVAIERLSTPEQLDQLVTLTSPANWITAATVWGLLAGIIAWSLVGTVPTYVEAEGLLVSAGGAVFDVPSPAQGRVRSLAVTLGARVTEGMLIAELDQSQLQEELHSAQQVVAERTRQLADLRASFERETRANQETTRRQLESLTRLRESARERRTYLAASLKHLEELESRGLTTRTAVADTRQRHHEAAQEILRAESDLVKLDADTLAMTARQDKETREAEEKLNDARRHVSELTLKLSRSLRVEAGVAGIVTEIKAPVGTMVDTGRSVVSLESGSSGLEGVVFVESDKGKDVRADLPVRIQPVHIRKEEFGSVVGQVGTVSVFPVTAEGMLSILQNGKLVERFTKKGAPYLARVTVATDPATPSGLKWTSGSGPPVAISNGTLVKAEITVREQHPIELVLPLLRKFSGLNP